MARRMVQVRLSEAGYAALVALSSEHGLTLSETVRRLLGEALDERVSRPGKVGRFPKVGPGGDL